MDRYDVIIVGAGISGLSFAHYANKAGKSVAVLEKAPKCGGSFDSAMTEQNDFWIELGAHTCYNSYGNLIGIIEDCGMEGEISPRARVPFRLLMGNDIKSFTSQINFLELLTSLPRAFSKKKEGESVKSYYGSILGKKNFSKVFSSLFSAVPSQNADDFPADALFKKRSRRKDIIKNYTMNKGLASITDAIAKHDNLEIKYGASVAKIETNQTGYKIKTNLGVFACDHLCIATPVTVAAGLIDGIASEVASAVSKIEHQMIESFGVVVPKAEVELKPFAGLVPLNDSFFSVVSRDTVPDEKFRGFTFHFKPDVLSREEKKVKACEVLGISADSVVQSFEKLNIVPSLRLGHYDLVNKIEELLKGKPLYITGNYFAGLSIEDCVSKSKFEVERMLGG